MAGPRILGHVTCRGCKQRVQVQYAYSNSDRSVIIQDHPDESLRRHDDPPAYYPRCVSAGWTLIDDGKWLRQAGYTPDQVDWEQTVLFGRES
jgi:hypothetical protein